MTARTWASECGPSRPIGSDDLRAIFRRHPAGVAVVALADGDRPVGFTATSVISVSADPAVVAFSIADTSSSWPALSRAATLTVNFLTADQVDVSARFATSGIDRFAGVDWSWLPTGEPVLDGVAGWLRAEVIQRTPVGASHLVAVQALQVQQYDAAAPLVYFDRSYHRVDGLSAL